MYFVPRYGNIDDVDDVTSPAVSTCIVGIRSQSKPLDIMHEVFKAMKSLDYVSCFLCYLAYQWCMSLSMAAAVSWWFWQ